MSEVPEATYHPIFPPLGRSRVTPEMLSAGRVAFMAKRAMLSDLYKFFDCDLTEFLSAVYHSMAAVDR